MLHVSETESSQETEGNVLVYRHHCLHHFVDFLAKLSVVLSLQYSSLTLMLHTWLKLGRFFPSNNIQHVSIVLNTPLSKINSKQPICAIRGNKGMLTAVAAQMTSQPQPADPEENIYTATCDQT